MFYTVIYTVIIIGAALLKYRNSLINIITTNGETMVINENESDYTLILQIIIFITLLMLLNVWSIMDFWLDSKKTEYFVRKLSGATDEAIILRIFINYAGLIAISFIASLCVVVIVRICNIFINSYLYLSPTLCLIAYFSMLVSGVIIGSWKVSRFVRKELTTFR